MTPEEKQLLFQDLCTRLPYQLTVNWNPSEGVFKNIESNENSNLEGWLIQEVKQGTIKPYLRSMSSMTEEEKEELKNICTMYDCDMGSDYECFGIKIFNISRYGIAFESNYVAIDWLNKKMFDYHGLISIGLALEAPEDMYNTKIK